MKKSILILFTVFLLASCSSNASNEDKQTIFTSIYPLQYITEEIVGESAEVISMYPPGVDAHTYEPTTKQLTSLAKSDLFIFMGAGMEGFAEHAADALADTGVAFLEIGENETIFRETDEEDEHDHHENHEHDHHGHSHDVDPHVWMDPKRMITMAEMVTEQVSTLHPENKALYEENFLQLKEKLLAIDEAFEDMLANKKNKEMIVTHAAYGYWEEAYGIQQFAISGISSSDEPSQKELSNVIKEADARQLQYVAFEKNTSNQVAEIIQEHIGADAVYIHNLETLTEEDIEKGNDYESIMYDNIEVLDQILD